jgi:DNA-directed RNA polymerase subunit RPC12/RpoP
MAKIKPRGPVPSLIGAANGRPKRVPIKNNGYECSRCHAPFIAGQTCIAIPKLGAGYSSDKRVCDDCFKEILQKTSEDLEAVRSI